MPQLLQLQFRLLKHQLQQLNCLLLKQLKLKLKLKLKPKLKHQVLPQEKLLEKSVMPKLLSLLKIKQLWQQMPPPLLKQLSHILEQKFNFHKLKQLNMPLPLLPLLMPYSKKKNHGQR
jgi:hypothetical protein